jgi:acyl-coenzyme A thioesterase PaaI-like protein
MVPSSRTSCRVLTGYPGFTSELNVRFLRVPPSDRPVLLRARVVESDGDRATVEASAESDGHTTVTCRGVFVAVKEGHPAFGRW